MTSLEIRTATHSDLPAIHLADGRAFGEQHSTDDRVLMERLIPPERLLLALDAGTVVGVTAVMPLRMTLPGGAQQEAAGISAVSVAVTHRRRGVLRQIFTAQHRRLVEDGAVLGALTASEATIYGRFGYGPAVGSQRVEIERRHVQFRGSAPDPGGVRQVEAEEARSLLPEVHGRWQRQTPGALHRSELWWEWRLSDLPEARRGASALFFLVHPDGYATYRVSRSDRGRSADVVDLVAATPDAHAALWRVLLGLDILGVVTADLPTDDPLPFLVTDVRAVRVLGADDRLWVRPLDVPAALAARRYACELDVVVAVDDPFLGQGGTFRLTGGPDGARCTPTDAAPEVHLGVAALGSVYLGGHRLGTLARAGLVQVDDPRVLSRVDLAFLADRSPAHGTDF